MRNIKSAFDPDGILNPGKLLPDAAGAMAATETGEHGARNFDG
jgi:hypothetical protein